MKDNGENDGPIFDVPRFKDISLRDWFAGQALCAIAARHIEVRYSAAKAYDFAAAMLKERDKIKEEPK